VGKVTATGISKMPIESLNRFLMRKPIKMEKIKKHIFGKILFRGFQKKMVAI